MLVYYDHEGFNLLCLFKSTSSAIVVELKTPSLASFTATVEFCYGCFDFTMKLSQQIWG